MVSQHCVQVLVTTDDLQQWSYSPINADYLVRAVPVDTTQNPPMETGLDETVRDGISLLDVLRLGAPNVTPASVTKVVIANSDGRNTSVTGPDMRNAAASDTDPYGNALVPVIYSSAGYRSGGAAQYLRPLLAGSFEGTDPDDTNATDAILNRPSQAMIVQFHTGSTEILSPVLHATPNPVQVNAPVTFTVTRGCTQADPNNSVDVHYGDGGTGSTSHRYQVAGTYTATADIGCADGSAGSTSPISVIVKGPHRSTPAPRSTGATDASGGGGPQHNGAPTSESDPPDRVGLESSAPASGPAGTGDVGGSNGPTGSTAPAGASTGHGTGSAAARATGRPSRNTAAAVNGARVVGYLLGPAPGGVVVASQPPPRPAAAPSTVARPTHGHVIAALLTGLVLLMLLGFGAGAEWRRPSSGGRRR